MTQAQLTDKAWTENAAAWLAVRLLLARLQAGNK